MATDPEHLHETMRAQVHQFWGDMLGPWVPRTGGVDINETPETYVWETVMDDRHSHNCPNNPDRTNMNTEHKYTQEEIVEPVAPKMRFNLEGTDCGELDGTIEIVGTFDLDHLEAIGEAVSRESVASNGMERAALSVIVDGPPVISERALMPAVEQCGTLAFAAREILELRDRVAAKDRELETVVATVASSMGLNPGSTLADCRDAGRRGRSYRHRLEALKAWQARVAHKVLGYDSPTVSDEILEHQIGSIVDLHKASAPVPQNSRPNGGLARVSEAFRELWTLAGSENDASIEQKLADVRGLVEAGQRRQQRFQAQVNEKIVPLQEELRRVAAERRAMVRIAEAVGKDGEDLESVVSAVVSAVTESRGHAENFVKTRDELEGAKAVVRATAEQFGHTCTTLGLDPDDIDWSDVRDAIRELQQNRGYGGTYSILVEGVEIDVNVQTAIRNALLAQLRVAVPGMAWVGDGEGRVRVVKDGDEIGALQVEPNRDEELEGARAELEVYKSKWPGLALGRRAAEAYVELVTALDMPPRVGETVETDFKDGAHNARMRTLAELRDQREAAKASDDPLAGAPEPVQALFGALRDAVSSENPVEALQELRSSMENKVSPEAAALDRDTATELDAKVFTVAAQFGVTHDRNLETSLAVLEKIKISILELRRRGQVCWVELRPGIPEPKRTCNLIAESLEASTEMGAGVTRAFSQMFPDEGKMAPAKRVAEVFAGWRTMADTRAQFQGHCHRIAHCLKTLGLPVQVEATIEAHWRTRGHQLVSGLADELELTVRREQARQRGGR